MKSSEAGKSSNQLMEFLREIFILNEMALNRVTSTLARKEVK